MVRDALQHASSTDCAARVCARVEAFTLPTKIARYCYTSAVEHGRLFASRESLPFSILSRRGERVSQLADVAIGLTSGAAVLAAQNDRRF